MGILPRKMRDPFRSTSSPQPGHFLGQRDTNVYFPSGNSWPAAPGLWWDKDWAMQHLHFEGRWQGQPWDASPRGSQCMERRGKLSSLHNHTKKGNPLFRMLSPQKTSWKTTSARRCPSITHPVSTEREEEWLLSTMPKTVTSFLLCRQMPFSIPHTSPALLDT